jgi:stage III sporulation protein AE
MLLQLIGILLLRAVYGCFSSSIRSAGVGRCVGLVCRTVLFCFLIGQARGCLEGVVRFFQELQTLTNAYLPLMGAAYAMGGNVATAVANQSTLMLAFLLVEWMGGKTVVPLFCLCLAFSMLGAFDSSVAGRMQVLTGRLKKWYATALGLVMLLLSGALAAQTTLAARTDSLGFRAVRFAVSNSIPLVGGGVAEMLRTAATGVSWLRGIVGVGGVVLIVWLLLPEVLSLLLFRWALSVAEDIGSWLGCGEETRLIGEIGGLCGYLLAVVSISVMTFFFSLVLLARCGASFA